MIDKKETKEEWRDIPAYEGYYQVSNLGKVKSLDRTVVSSDGRERLYKGRDVEGSVSGGYRLTTLTKHGFGRTYKFSQLVAMAFLEHEPNGQVLVVDHVNGDKSDDRLENLRIVTQRANSSTCFRSNKGSLSSEYVGVGWGNQNSKWWAQISFNGNDVYLGSFTNEIDASNAYQSALTKIETGSFNPVDYKPKFTSKHKGVGFDKSNGKWKTRIQINGKNKHIGYFLTELEAHQAYQDKLKELDNNTNK